MDPKDPKINKILKTELHKIYGQKIQQVEIQNIMQYPLKEDLYVVIYNLDLEDSYPIRRAKIVVDAKEEELKAYDPGLL